MTKYQQFVQKWSGGCGSSLCSLAANKCFAKGPLPATVVFCGEAPGSSEDGLGDPFSGPAGHLLDKVITNALEIWQPPVRVTKRYGTVFRHNDVTCAYTNLTACFPSEQKKAGTNAPPNEAIEACAPRLKEFVEMARPRLVVCVGGLAEKWVPKILTGFKFAAVPNFPVGDTRFVAIVHPAFILSKMNPAMQGLAVQKCVVAISDAIEELFQ